MEPAADQARVQALLLEVEATLIHQAQVQVPDLLHLLIVLTQIQVPAHLQLNQDLVQVPALQLHLDQVQVLVPVQDLAVLLLLFQL